MIYNLKLVIKRILGARNPRWPPRWATWGWSKFENVVFDKFVCVIYAIPLILGCKIHFWCLFGSITNIFTRIQDGCREMVAKRRQNMKMCMFFHNQTTACLLAANYLFCIGIQFSTKNQTYIPIMCLI